MYVVLILVKTNVTSFIYLIIFYVIYTQEYYPSRYRSKFSEDEH